MKEMLKKVLKPIWTVVDKYPIIVAGVAIYLYYLLTSINLFSHVEQKKSFVDYILQFDSLIWMWVAAAALLQVQRLRKREREQSDARHTYQLELERQQIHSSLITDITELLQDNINNPLAIISTQTQQIRRRFQSDVEIVRWIDSIESSLKRIENTIRDLKSYETEKMISEMGDRMKNIRDQKSGDRKS